MIDAVLRSAKEAVASATRELAERGLVIQNFGNVSQRVPGSDSIAIKPSGFSGRYLRPDDVVIVDIHSGLSESGDRRPSSDTATHISLYRAYPEIGGVVHTHSPFATAWAQAMQPIPRFGTTHADYFYGPVPITAALTEQEVQGNYEENTGAAMCRCLSSLGGKADHIPGILVGSHGPFAWGADARAAIDNAEAIEFIARLAYLTLNINCESREIGEPLARRHFFRKHGPTATYGQADLS